MYSCPNCDAGVEPSDSFCEKCGAELESSGTEEAALSREEFEEYAEHFGPQETPQYILKGATLKTEGNIDSTKSSLSGGGGVKTIVTDERVFIHVKKRITGDDMRTLPYESINAVNLDTGIVNNFLSLQTGGGTYKVQVLDKADAKDAIEYIRTRKRDLAQGGDGGGNEPDPTEQLKNIKELHEQGVLSDEEFETKKQTLLDKI